jgi:hypothetical protein
MEGLLAAAAREVVREGCHGRMVMGPWRELAGTFMTGPETAKGVVSCDIGPDIVMIWWTMEWREVPDIKQSRTRGFSISCGIWYLHSRTLVVETVRTYLLICVLSSIRCLSHCYAILRYNMSQCLV